MSEADSICGCKGANHCGLCINSDRVKGLHYSVPPEEKVAHLQQKIYCQVCGLAFAASFSDYYDLSRVLAEASSFHEIHVKQKLLGEPVNKITLLLDFISEEEERDLVETIDSVDWLLSQSGRRKQDHGPRVNFKKKKLKYEQFTGIPDYADLILARMANLNNENLGNYQPFELCNLDYKPENGSWIGFHCDDTWIWGERLISVNLLSGSVMTLIQEDSGQMIAVPMQRRSLLCMAGEIRYQWKHGILASHIDKRRIALTMREPSHLFRPGGELYHKYGRDLIERGNRRIIVGQQGLHER